MSSDAKVTLFQLILQQLEVITDSFWNKLTQIIMSLMAGRFTIKDPFSLLIIFCYDQCTKLLKESKNITYNEVLMTLRIE